MKTINILSSSVVLALSMGTITVSAADGNFNFSERLLSKYDANQDGVITLVEVQAQREAFFDDADVDGDGYLTADELQAAKDTQRNERIAERIAEMDTNGDGALSEDEVVAVRSERARRMFAHLDSNGDGLLTVDEMAAQDGRHHGHGSNSVEQHFARLDNDGDGLISRDEYVSAFV